MVCYFLYNKVHQLYVYTYPLLLDLRAMFQKIQGRSYKVS